MDAFQLVDVSIVVARFAYFSRDVRDEETGNALWWNDQNGWGSVDDATLYTETEIKNQIDAENAPRLNGDMQPFIQIDCVIPDNV